MAAAHGEPAREADGSIAPADERDVMRLCELEGLEELHALAGGDAFIGVGTALGNEGVVVRYLELIRLVVRCGRRGAHVFEVVCLEMAYEYETETRKQRRTHP